MKITSLDRKKLHDVSTKFLYCFICSDLFHQWKYWRWFQWWYWIDKRDVSTSIDIIRMSILTMTKDRLEEDQTTRLKRFKSRHTFPDYFLFRPNVCSKIEIRSLTKVVPCVKSYDHLVKVWSHNCTEGRRICPVYEHRFVKISPKKFVPLISLVRNIIEVNKRSRKNSMSPHIIVVLVGHVLFMIMVVQSVRIDWIFNV